jgi:hypothetical protein
MMCQTFSGIQSQPSLTGLNPYVVATFPSNQLLGYSQVSLRDKKPPPVNPVPQGTP